MPKNIYLSSSEELIKYINEDLPNESLIILDSALEQFKLHSNFNASHVYLKVSEETKNLETVEKIWEIMFSSNLNRSDAIVIIGGGVMLDLCSFAASTYKRGIAFTLVPSTLLAMVDRIGFLKILKRMNAKISIENLEVRDNESVGDIHVSKSNLSSG